MPNDYVHPSGIYSLLVHGSWNAEEMSDRLVIWRTRTSGTVIVRAFEHSQQATRVSATDECRRFLRSVGQDEVAVLGDFNRAEATFATDDGDKWWAVVSAQGNRFALGLYNAAKATDQELAEGLFTIRSLRIL